MFIGKYSEFKENMIENLKKNPQKISPKLYFTKQTVQNACGTVGLIHALANNKKHLNIHGKKDKL